MANVDETWMPYRETEYEVSNKGNVRHKETKTYRNLYRNPVNEYITVGIKIDGVNKLVKVHRMMAEAFNLPRNEQQTCIDHINNCRTDNRLENIRWCTHTENNNNKLPRKTNTGENHITKHTQNKSGKGKHADRMYTYEYYSFNYKNLISKSFKTLDEAKAARETFMASLRTNAANAQS